MTDQLGPDFDDRLRSELDRVAAPTPRPEHARFSRADITYRRLGRMKPVLAIAGALGILTVAATALASSPDPGVWTRRVVYSFESVTHPVQLSPSPASGGSHHDQAQPSGSGDGHHESPEPSSGSQPEPPESPSTSPSPEPDGHDSSSPTPSPTPVPGSDDGAHESPSPSPSGSDS